MDGRFLFRVYYHLLGKSYFAIGFSALPELIGSNAKHHHWPLNRWEKGQRQCFGLIFCATLSQPSNFVRFKGCVSVISTWSLPFYHRCIIFLRRCSALTNLVRSESILQTKLPEQDQIAAGESFFVLLAAESLALI